MRKRAAGATAAGDGETPRPSDHAGREILPKSSGRWKAFMLIAKASVVIAVLFFGGLYLRRATHWSVHISNQSSSEVLVFAAYRPLHIGLLSYFAGQQNVAPVSALTTVPRGAEVALDNGGIYPFYQRCAVFAVSSGAGRAALEGAMLGATFDSMTGVVTVRDGEIVNTFTVVDSPADLVSSRIAPLGTGGGPIGIDVLAPHDHAIYRYVMDQLDATAREFVEEVRSRVVRLWQTQPNASAQATVRVAAAMSAAEQAYRAQRRPVAKAALNRFLKRDPDAEGELTIAFGGSGGGYRAMIAYMGLLRGAERLGLLDAASYVAGVSGSTWTLAQFYSSAARSNGTKVTMGEVCELASERAQLDMSVPLPYKTFADAGWVLERVMDRYLAGQGLSVVDIYGTHISHYVLKDGGDESRRLSLSEQAGAVRDGRYPLPIYTAVFREAGRFEWLELSPFEVGMTDKHAYVPTWAFGRKYTSGVSAVQSDDTGYSAEPALGMLCGVFGSAFCATVDLIFAEVEAHLPDRVVDYVKNVIEDSLNIADKSPIPPASVPNFAYGVPELEGWEVAKDQWLPIMDAGISFNIPVPPLITPSRGVDVLFIMDASVYGGRAELVGSELRKAEEYAARHGVPFPKIDYTHVHDRTASVFRGARGTAQPTVVYLPLIRRPGSTFDPQGNAASGGFTSTYNFKYTAEEFNLLAGHMEAALTGSAGLIADALLATLEHPPVRGGDAR